MVARIKVMANLNTAEKRVPQDGRFKIEVNDEGVVFAKLTYSQFLYYVDKRGDLCKYKEERDFNESEYKYSVQKRKPQGGAPVHNGGMVNTSKLDEI